QQDHVVRHRTVLQSRTGRAREWFKRHALWATDEQHSNAAGTSERSSDQVLVGLTTRTCSSCNCASGTMEGASVIRSWAVEVFGNAMTSRIESVPAISAAMRSMPNAMPPCGGAP